MRYQSSSIRETGLFVQRSRRSASTSSTLQRWLESVAVLLHRKKAAMQSATPVRDENVANNSWSYRTAASEEGKNSPAASDVRWQPRQIDPDRLEAHLRLLDVGLRLPSVR
jgi:hypothetical protein